MLIELKKFYDNLEAQHTAALSKDVNSIVAERIAKLTESVRHEVESEIAAELAVLDIKKQTIAEAIEVLQLKATEAVEPVVPELEPDVTFSTAETD